MLHPKSFPLCFTNSSPHNPHFVVHTLFSTPHTVVTKFSLTLCTFCTEHIVCVVLCSSCSTHHAFPSLFSSPPPCSIIRSPFSTLQTLSTVLPILFPILLIPCSVSKLDSAYAALHTPCSIHCALSCVRHFLTPYSASKLHASVLQTLSSISHSSFVRASSLFMHILYTYIFL